MKQYAAYKPSGVAWLGDVPDHWEVISLRRLFTVKSGDQTTTEDLVEEGFPVYGGNGQRGFYTDWNTEANSILIGRYGALCGNVHVVKERAWATEHAFRVIPFLPFDADFLGYSLESLNLNQFSARAAQPGLNATLVRENMCALPPLPEQCAIAAFLDERTAHLDGLIRRKEDLLKLLAEQRAALITRAVTRGLDAAAPLQESGVPWLGQVPAHWLITRLKFVADVHSGIAKGKKYLPTQELVEIPYLRVANVQDGYLKLDDITTISVTPAEAKSYELQPQDILMNEGGDNDKLGRGTVWEGQIAPCIHQNHVFAIRHHGKVDSWFLSYFFGSTACKPYFLLSGNQATNLASISASAISDTPLALPPLDEQREIVVAINQGNERLDKMTDITTREIAKLREYRAALITAAVTGRIDVRAGVAVDEPALVEAL